MDHVLSYPGTLRSLLDWYIKEHRKGQYKKLSDNPYYEEIKALIDAMNILRKYLGWETIKLSEEVSWRLEG